MKLLLLGALLGVAVTATAVAAFLWWALTHGWKGVE